MFKLVYLGIAALLASGANSAAMSLSEAVRLAVETNPNVEAAEARYRQSEQRLKQSMGRLYPEIDILGEYGKYRIDRPEGLGPDVNNVWRNNRAISAEFRQILFDGFDRANDIYRSRAKISASSESLLARSETVALNGVEAYIDVARLTELLGYANENVQRHIELAEIIRASFSGGNAPIGDLQQTEERIQAAKSLVTQVKISLDTARAKFKNAIGIEATNLKGVPFPADLPHSSDSAFSFAMSHNPRVRASLSEIDASEFETKQFQGSLYPQLSLEGAARKGQNLDGTPGRDNELRGMFVVSWKLFDGGIRTARVQELNEKSNELRAEHDVLLRQLQEEIEIAWARYTEGRIQVAAIRKQLEQNTQLVKTYFDEYEAQKRSLLDVLNAEATRFRNRYELSNSEFLRLFSSYELLANMGKLLQNFGLDGDDTYVVEEYVNEFGANIGNSGKLGAVFGGTGDFGATLQSIKGPSARSVSAGALRAKPVSAKNLRAKQMSAEDHAPIQLLPPQKEIVSRELAPLKQ